MLAVAAAVAPATAVAGGDSASVIAVPGLELAGVGDWPGGALGLVVPDAGPRTSEERALAALASGEVVNSLRGEPPSGEPLLPVFVARFGRGSPMSGPPLAVVGVPRGGTQPNDRRYPIVLVGRTGLLTSDSTRIPGLVSIDDVARGRIRVEPSEDPVAALRELDARIRDNDRSRPLAGALIAALIALLALVRPLAAVLAFGTVAATNLALGIAGLSEPWLVVPLLGLGTLAAVPLARVLRTPAAAGAALVAVVAAYLVAMAADVSWVALSPLGPSQNGRFYGLTNLLETILLVPALAGAAFLSRRFGLAAVAAVAALSLVAVAASRFGADGGGAIVLAVGFAVLGGALAGGGRRAVGLAAACGLAAVALVAADALVGPGTHVGDSVRDGPGAVARDLRDRLELSWERATDSAAVALAVAAALVLLAVLAVRGPRTPLPLAVLAAVATSLVVNDSPKEVAVGGLVAYLAVERLARAGEDDPPGYTGFVPLRS